MTFSRTARRSIHHARPAVWFAAAVFAAACGDKVGVSGESSSREVAVASSQQAPAGGAPAASYWASQKLIRSAELRIEVDNVQKAVRLADSLVKLRGALVADSRTSQDAQGHNEAELAVRVPSQHFTATLVALRQVGDVKNEALSTQDVSKEYADLDTRLAVKEQTVARLRSLIDNRTAKLADVLEVERELARAVTELEQMKGERRFYDQQIALSTITLKLFDHAATRSTRLTGPVGDAFRNSLDVLGTSFAGVIYVITFILPWLIIALPAWWLVRRWRARYGRGSDSSDARPKP